MDCSPSDALLAVSRLLAPAGGSVDPADVRAAVVREAARFFGAPCALLLELAESDRRVRVIASTGVPEPDGGLHNVAALPALEDFVAGRLAHAELDADAARQIL